MSNGAPEGGGPVQAVHLSWGQMEAVDPASPWLTPAERALLDAFRVPKRAADWRLGRWLAKQAVAALLGGGLTRRDVEVLPTPGGGPRARVTVPGIWPSVSLSLSHAGGMGLAAAAKGVLRLGCDVEQIAARSEAFVTDYFTAAEAVWIRSGPGSGEVRANLLWSAKESALKALGKGLRLDTRRVPVEVEPDVAGPGAWGRLMVRSPAGDTLPGVWCAAHGFVWTVVADRPFRILGGPEPDPVALRM